MKILKNPFFYTSVFIAISIYAIQSAKLSLPTWVAFYANDFLCMPIVLSLCLAFIRWIKKNETLYVPLSVIVILTTYYAVFFEFVLPKINTRYTFDIIDIGLYFLGASLFYKFQKKLF